MDGIIENKEEYLKKRGSVNDRLKMAHAQTKKPSPEELKELQEDLRINTIEGKSNHLDHKKDVDFAVANNLPASHRLKLVHEFDAREVVLLEQHRQHKLTRIPPE